MNASANPNQTCTLSSHPAVSLSPNDRLQLAPCYASGSFVFSWLDYSWQIIDFFFFLRFAASDHFYNYSSFRPNDGDVLAQPLSPSAFPALCSYLSDCPSSCHPWSMHWQIVVGGYLDYSSACCNTMLGLQVRFCMRGLSSDQPPYFAAPAHWTISFRFVACLFRLPSRPVFGKGGNPADVCITAALIALRTWLGNQLTALICIERDLLKSLALYFEGIQLLNMSACLSAHYAYNYCSKTS